MEKRKEEIITGSQIDSLSYHTTSSALVFVSCLKMMKGKVNLSW